MPPSPSCSKLRILSEMRSRGEATRPQLARACALSLVTVNRMVASLCASGDVEPVGEVSSGGGRPVQLYRLRRAASWAALLHIARTGTGIFHVRLELLDPLGSLLQQVEARFAHLEEGSLDAWLDDLLKNPRRLLGVTISADATPLPTTLCRHLAERYHCPCRRVSAADALANLQEGSLTLVLAPGRAPTGTLCRNAKRHSCGALELLPLPADWQTLDDSDHTLVEEMVARLLLILTCTLSPERVVIFGSVWSERLLRRIRYNLATKLRNSSLPPLRFRHLTPEGVHDALIRLTLEAE